MSHVTNDQRQRIQRYLLLEERDLYALIPPHLPDYDQSLFSPDGQIDAGKGFFQSKLKELRKAVCDDFDWPSKRSDTSFNDSVQLVAAVADAVVTCVGGVPPFIIAALLVKRGLDALCGCS